MPQFLQITIFIEKLKNLSPSPFPWRMEYTNRFTFSKVVLEPTYRFKAGTPESERHHSGKYQHISQPAMSNMPRSYFKTSP